MEIIKLENQKNDSFFEAECFLHIGEAKEDKNYVAFDLRREDDPLYSCSYYDFEKEKGDKIFHCFDGQDYSWKCFENEVTNDEKLKNEILGNYDILRNSTIRYLKEIIHKNKVDFSKKLIELLEKIKAGEKINKKEFRIELKKVGLYKSIWKEKTEIFDDVVKREIGFEKIMKFIEENNVNRVIFEDGKFLEKEEIRKYIKEYTIVEFRDFKPIKDFDMIKMTLEEWNNLKKWKKLEVENNIIEIEEKDQKIRIFSHLNSDFNKDHEGGASYVRNFGIKNAKGSYIQLFDDDNEIDPQYLEHTLKLHQTYTQHYQNEVIITPTLMRRNTDKIQNQGFSDYNYRLARPMIHFLKPEQAY